MSWGRGSELFSDVAEIIAENVVDDNIRRLIYMGLIEAFQNYDCDTLDECMDIDPVLDTLLEAMALMEESEDEDDEWPDGGRENF
jgi:hypothetical protein